MDVEVVSSVIMVDGPITTKQVGWQEPRSERLMEHAFRVEPLGEDASPKYPCLRGGTALVKVKPCRGATGPVEFSAMKRFIDCGFVGVAQVGDHGDLKIKPAIVDENDFVFGEERVVDGLVHNVFVVDSLEWCYKWVV
jgi:hypothetical protein